jgi:hypothetical protein
MRTASVLVLVLPLAVACAPSFEGKYRGTANETVSFPEGPTGLGNQQLAVEITKDGSDAYEIRFGECVINGRRNDKMISLFDAGPGACKVPLSDGSRALVTTLIGHGSTTENGIRLAGQGSVGLGAPGEMSGSYKLSFEGARQ